MKIIYRGKLYDTRKMKYLFGGVWHMVPLRFYQHNDGRYFKIYDSRFVEEIDKGSLKAEAEAHVSARKYIKLFGPVEEA